ncbi:MAG: stage IV sporulation protein A, partial [Lachnospiraceae bacterium]
MANTSIYKDIADRTGGDIYIGVVGPVRSGKSTFIKRFMDMFVLPAIEDENEKTRVTDELPQSAAGRTIMTTQPGFIPNRAVSITVGENVRMNVRMVDCVGYLIDGAQGHTEDGGARMVMTPWSESAMPFEQAADIGTKKVIAEHSTIGIVMTTDGSIADIPRSAYVPAEERVVAELTELNKPFVILLNCMDAQSDEAYALAEELQKKYSATVIPINAMSFSEQDIADIMSDLLYEFPIKQINLDISKWICALDPDHYLICEIYEKLKAATDNMRCMKDYPAIAEAFSDLDYVKNCSVSDISMGEGSINVTVRPDDHLFYKVLGEQTGCDIKDDRHLISIIKDMAEAKAHYTRLENAIK